MPANPDHNGPYGEGAHRNGCLAAGYSRQGTRAIPRQRGQEAHPTCEHRQSGLDDMRRTPADPCRPDRSTPEFGIVTHDVHRGEDRS
jgi:hypothetical protein